MTQTLTIDIGGTTCAVAITDDDGVTNLESWLTEGSTVNLDRVVDYYRDYRAAGGEPVDSIGVCFGGPVDHASATVTRSVHVPGWQGFDFREWATEHFGLPISVDNDAKVGALAEYRLGGHGTSDLVYVTVSTGIGLGAVSDGRLVRGTSNEAGELGHTRVSGEQKRCSCGRTGCLERLCSGYWLEHDYGKPPAELFADEGFLAEYGKSFARGLVNAVLLYNPAVVVLGGGVSRVGSRLSASIRDGLRTELASWEHMLPNIVISAFDHEGVHRGAKELTRDLF